MNYQTFLELLEDLCDADKREQSQHLSKLAEAISVEKLNQWRVMVTQN